MCDLNRNLTFREGCMFSDTLKDILELGAWDMSDGRIPKVNSIFFEERDIDFTPTVGDLASRVVDWIYDRSHEFTEEHDKYFDRLERIFLKILSPGDDALLRVKKLERRSDSILACNDDLNLQIFQYLDGIALAKSLKVSSGFCKLAKMEQLWKVLPPPAVAFGKREWAKYFGDIGEEPPLPKNIYHVLKNRCHIWPEKMVEETHELVLIPKSVNGKDLTLELLFELIKTPLGKGNVAKKRLSCRAVMTEHGNRPVSESHWVLMTKEIIPGSIDKSYPEQQSAISALAEKTQIDYQIPTILNAATVVFMKYVRTKQRLLYAIPPKYSFCQEEIRGSQVVFGNFTSSGLSIDCFWDKNKRTGVSAMRILKRN